MVRKCLHAAQGRKSKPNQILHVSSCMETNVLRNGLANKYETIHRCFLPYGVRGLPHSEVTTSNNVLLGWLLVWFMSGNQAGDDGEEWRTRKPLLDSVCTWKGLKWFSRQSGRPGCGHWGGRWPRGALRMGGTSVRHT